jgi:hypothetical protein
MSNDERSDRIVARLETERPIPRAAFRGELRRTLLAGAEQRPTAPARLRLIIAAFASSGTALLAIAAIGLAGVGPLAAG